MEEGSNAEGNARIFEVFANSQAKEKGVDIRVNTYRVSNSGMLLEIIIEGNEYTGLKDVLSEVLKTGNSLGAKFENDEFQIFSGNLVNMKSLRDLLWEFGADINENNTKKGIVLSRPDTYKNLVKFTLSFN